MNWICIIVLCAVFFVLGMIWESVCQHKLSDEKTADEVTR